MSKLDAHVLWLEHGVDVRKRRLLISGAITEKSARRFLQGLHVLEEASPDPITVVLSTPGGCVYSGLAMYDALKLTSCHVTTVGTGMVMSMGTWIILAGDSRLATPNCSFMWHAISSGVWGKTHDVITEAEEMKRLTKRLIEIYAENTARDFKWWDRWIKHQDRYGGVDLALSLGVVDAVRGAVD